MPIYLEPINVKWNVVCELKYLITNYSTILQKWNSTVFVGLVIAIFEAVLAAVSFAYWWNGIALNIILSLLPTELMIFSVALILYFLVTRRMESSKSSRHIFEPLSSNP